MLKEQKLNSSLTNIYIYMNDSHTVREFKILLMSKGCIICEWNTPNVFNA